MSGRIRPNLFFKNREKYKLIILKFPKLYYFIGIPTAALIFMLFAVEKIIAQVKMDFFHSEAGGRETADQKA